VKWFKDIPGYEGRYAVDVIGNVFSYRAKRLMKLSASSNGHLCTGIDGKTRYVHDLVLTTFVGPRPQIGDEGNFIGRHLDGNCLNNSIFNLEWSTYRQNTMDRKWHGPTKNYKLSIDDVRSIKARLLLGERITHIARDYNVTPSNINQIAKGKIHTDISGVV